MNENIFYVYMHVDPDSKEVLYIGMGQGSRAYATKTVKINTTRYGHRSPEHAKHLDDLLDKGYLPHEWITFIKRGLHKQDALLLEKDSIEKYLKLISKLLIKSRIGMFSDSIFMVFCFFGSF